MIYPPTTIQFTRTHAGLPKPKKSMQTGLGASSNMDSAASAALTAESADTSAGAGEPVHGIATGDEGPSALDLMAGGDGDGDTSGIKPIKFPAPGKLEGITSRGKPVMRMTDVEFSYPGTSKVILSGLNCALSQNSRVALLGPNGAGKSTLLKLLVGEQEVSV
jgi:ABC-type molybdenum transport system ATPase subunit/photorepair protein PhrA